jgi:hypothetical protein
LAATKVFRQDGAEQSFLRPSPPGTRIPVKGLLVLYGQVIKTRRNNRIVKVERRALIGAAWRFEEGLRKSEDSSKLNTSFVERLNLTIRQGSAYLFRRTICYLVGRSASEGTLSCFAATTTSLGLIGR